MEINGKTANNHIIVENVFECKVSPSGLSLGDIAEKTSSFQSAIVKVIPDDMTDIKIGDKIYYAKSGSFPIVLDTGESVTVVRYQSVVYIA